MNDLQSEIEAQLSDSSQVMLKTRETSGETIEKVCRIMISSLENRGKILLCGNGGSAADCQHIAAEIVGRFQINRPGLPAIALTTDSSILTAVSNDWGLDTIFARQVEALGRSGDVLLAISTSGSSPNILAAVRKAVEMEIHCIAMTGENDSPLSQHCDPVIKIPSHHVPRIQEGHITVGHILCDLIEKHFFAGHK